MSEKIVMNDKMNWKNVLTIGGAYTAYCIGAGFASGQETLQYYASWGGIYPFVLPALTFVLMFVICYGTFKTGYINRFPSPNAAYGYYCGKVLGKILDIFCTVSIALSTLIMFAGSGATVNQYLGAPVWVGTLVMGVVSVVVVCFGLEKVTNVLGFVGTLIIVILIGVGIYCFCTADSGVMQAQQNVQQYVDAGVIMRANFLGIENPILAVASLIGAYITLGLSFNVSLGGRCGSRREVSASAVISAVLFCLGLCMVLFTIIFNWIISRRPARRSPCWPRSRTCSRRWRCRSLLSFCSACSRRSRATCGRSAAALRRTARRSRRLSS